MQTETYAVHVSIPISDISRAEATFTVDSLKQAVELKKWFKGCDGEVYPSIVRTSIDNDYRPGT